MATPTSSTTTVSPHDKAIQLFQGLNELFPVLPKPHSGAIGYAIAVANNPGIDAIVCKSAGKVVHITAGFFARIEQEVCIRGNHSPLSWNTDKASDVQDSPNSHERTFTFPIPAEQGDDKIEFKLIIHQEGRVLWQKGNNCCIDLSQYGHIVRFDAGMITFQD